MDFFSVQERGSAPLRQSFFGPLQRYLDGTDPRESAIGSSPNPAASANDGLARFYQIRETMDGCVPRLEKEVDAMAKNREGSPCIGPFVAAPAGSPAREVASNVANYVSSNLNTEATSVTTVAVSDVAGWQHRGRAYGARSGSNPAQGGSGGREACPTGTANCISVNAASAKVGKKRSRASRRAPTTLLNTDTSNFRAMVQQFTGIPNAPFASYASTFSSVDSPARNSVEKPFAQRLLGQNFNGNCNTANLLPSLTDFTPQHSSLPVFPFQSLHAENMNSPFLLPSFFNSKSAAHGISEGQSVSAMNAGLVLGPDPTTALSFRPA